MQQNTNTNSEAKSNCEWITANDNIQVQGLTLYRGNFYLGKYFNVVQSLPNGIKYTPKDRTIQWATIDPELPIQQGVYKNKYFSSYHDLSQQGRFIYLSWLSNKISTNGIPDDILYLHLRGIQVRLFLDQTTTQIDREDIVNYLISLRMELELPLQTNILHYLNFLLDSVLTRFFIGNACKFNLSDIMLGSYANALVLSNESIDADKAFEIFKDALPNALPTQFDKYFIPYYRKKYRKVTLKERDYTYKNEIEIPIVMFGTYGLKKPKNFAKVCLYETRKIDSSPTIWSRFHRYLKEFEKYKKVAKDSITPLSPLAYFALPRFIQNNENQVLENFKKEFALIATKQETVVNFETLAKLFGIKLCDENLSRHHIETIMIGLNRLGYGIVTSLQVCNKLVSTKDLNVIYKFEKGQLICVDNKFYLLENLCKLIALVIQGTNPNEKDFSLIRSLLSEMNDNSHNLAYLNAYIVWLLQRNNSFTQGIKTTISNLSESNKSILLQILLKITTSSSPVNTKRIDSLSKILPYLDSKNRSIHSLIHQTLTENSDFTTILNGNKQNETLNLDYNKLNELKLQTEISQSLLSDIFTDKEENNIELITNINTVEEMLKLLLTKEVWKKDELDFICKNKGLILGAVLEEINDYSYSKIDDAVIEDNGDEILVALNYKEELL